jgi:excisionase family DNA binding protein
MLSRLADNGEVLIVNQEAELSPEEASRILNISRPMVYKRMDDGILSFRAIGKHRKILLKDVMALKAGEDRRKSASRELSEDAVDLELNHADAQSAP